jgi:hypothetical protein
MALVVRDRVKQFSTTSGTGTLTLGSTPNGFQPFSTIGDGNTTYYTIVNGSTGDFEVGIGTYTLSGDTLSRDTVLASSNSGSLVNFNADSKDVFVVYPAERAVFTDVVQTLTNKTISGANNTLSNIPNSATTATNANTASAIVARDASGDFSAGTITAALSGNATTSSSTTGNAATATALQNARTIGGVSFDGTANINLPGVNTAGNQNTTGTAANVTGTVAIANGGTGGTTAQAARNNIAAAVTSGQYLRGNGTNVLMSAIQAADVPTLNQSTTGNAATATALQTARTIGGVSFNGTANINLPGVNTAGNQNTTGSAATLTTARTINGTSFNGSANITTANWGTARTINGSSVNGSANVTTANWGTARTINGSSINGSANVTTANWGAARTLTIGVTGKSVNGSGNVSWSANEITGQTGNPPHYFCRAWVCFNGTTSPATIRASGNVSSVTRNGTGDYTVNFTTAMPDTNYAAHATAMNTITNAIIAKLGISNNAGNCRVFTGFSDSSTFVKSNINPVSFSAFR